jgi:hypothetical protein
MKTVSIICSALVGIIFGILSNHSILVGSWYNLIVWAVVGMLIGLFIEQKKFVNWVGIAYGIALTLSFLISGFKGTSDKIFGFGILSLVLTIIGAFCGWLCVLIGFSIKNKIRWNQL